VLTEAIFPKRKLSWESIAEATGMMILDNVRLEEQLTVKQWLKL